MTTLSTSVDILDMSDRTLVKSQEGERTITITGAAKLPLLTLDPVYGECVQDGTPAPDAPVKILSVKSPNLLPMTFTSWPKVSETGFDVQVEPSGYGATIIQGPIIEGTVELDGHTLTKTIRSFYQVDQGNDGGNLGFRFDGAPQRGIRSVTVGGYFKVSGDHASGDILFRIRNASYATIDEYKKAIPKNTWTFVHKTFVFTSDRAIADILLFARTTGNGSSSSYCTVETAGLFLGLNSAEINAYIPRNHIAVVCSNGNTAYIDMTDKETGDPVELYGFDDAHRDILRVDSTGHVTVEKKVHKLYFDGSDMAGWSVLGNYVSTGGGLWQYTVGDKTYTENADVIDKALCAISDRAVSKGFGVSQDQTGEFYIMKTGLGGNTLRFRPLDNGGVAQTVAQLQTWLQTHPTTILWQDPAYDYTIDLGYVDLPVVEDESVVHIAAEVQPIIGGTWWTQSGLKIARIQTDTLTKAAQEIDALNGKIQTLVYGLNGVASMTQTDQGFEITIDSYLSSLLNNLQKNIDGVSHDLGILIGNNASDISTLKSYIQVTTENDRPVVYLGSQSNDVYAAVTNTAFEFRSRSQVDPIAYFLIDDDGIGKLKINNAIILNELYFGKWVWKERKRDNMLYLMWTGDE